MKSVLQRKFIPGDKWLYFKIYMSPNESDSVLVESIYPFAMSEICRGHVDCWFFIRYSDPDYHLRLRLRLTDNAHLGGVVNSMFHKLGHFVKSGVVSKVMLDTYIREVERYGIETMEKCEDFFCQDSFFVIRITKNMLSDGMRIDWRVGLYHVDFILKSFMSDIRQRFEFVERLSDNYNSEFGYNSGNLKQINTLYRKYRADIENLLINNSELSSFILTEEIDVKEDFVKSIDKMSVLPSLLHMSMNRLYPIRQRLYEMVIYNFLRAVYKACIAKLGKGKIL